MPMIEFRFDSNKVNDYQSRVLGEKLEPSLRIAISSVRPDKNDYTITVEGDPFGSISHNQPDLRIYIFYHAEWNFTADELEAIANKMRIMVDSFLKALQICHISSKIRFYSRHGHVSS